ncbi:MscL family protein [Streptomyces sp. SBT349]|uniref:large conductance mechanosensitive channel protein MscL n=1 Tax=Streptomyces sp. SBT349 TaxID=1580539 RepID=UPI00066A4D66|nr:MscL family protein [Streptomyces sp. SBT349]
MVEGVRETLGGFRTFLLRGNVVELAVAVVVGTAFTSIVNSVVDGVINPVVGAFGTKDLNAYQSCLRGPCEVNAAGQVVDGIPIRWGSVLSASLTFLITAGVVYFLMILPLTRYLARRAAKDPVEQPVETELELLAEIRDELVAQRAAREAGVVVGGQRSAEPAAGGASGASPGSADHGGRPGDQGRE